MLTMSYFGDLDNKCYYQDITEEAKLLIEKKPSKWEDRLFLDVFKQQRAYLDSLLNITIDSSLCKYVLLQTAEEKPADYILRMIDRIKERANDNCFNYTFDKFMDARGRGVAGDAEKIIQVARIFFEDYIFYLEMLYDIEFLYLPKCEKIKKWFSVNINKILDDVYFVILDRLESFVSKVIANEDIPQDYFMFRFDMNLDINSLYMEFVSLYLENIQTDIKTIHYVPQKYLEKTNSDLIIIPLETYENLLIRHNSK